MMIGGKNSKREPDRLVGGDEDDILIGGTTRFDDHDAALQLIMNEWTSPRTYESRVRNLRGDSTNPDFGDRENGDVFLRTDSTVFNDGTPDILSGLSGLDWFIGDEDEDTFTDLVANVELEN